MDNKMSLTMIPDQKKAIAAAHEVLKDFDLADVQHVITEHTGYTDIFNGVDPDYSRVEKDQSELYKLLEKTLQTDEGKKALAEYEDNCTWLSSIREIGCFYLGYAAAQKLIGFRQAGNVG
jgi:hypothetical protein